MSPESALPTPDETTSVPVGDESAPVVFIGTLLAETLVPVRTPWTVLTGSAPLEDGDLEAMIRSLGPGGWVTRAVPVTDALKLVGDGKITGSVDRESVVALRLPILARTSLLRSIAAAAGEGRVDLVEALAAVGTGAAYRRHEALP